MKRADWITLLVVLAVTAFCTAIVVQAYNDMRIATPN
jgi:hypothetical protein